MSSFAPGSDGRLARFLRRSGPAWIEAWVDWVQRTPRGRHLRREDVRDSHTALVDAIVARAEGAPDAMKRIRAAARSHAAHRAEHGYRLEELLRENAAFRRIALHRIDEAGITFDVAEKNVLHESIDEAAVESARWFSEREIARERELLRASHDARTTLEEIFERTTEGFFALDAGYRFTYMNRAAEQMLGTSFESIRGERAWDAFPGVEPSAMGRAFGEAMETGRPVDRLLHHDLLNRWFDLRAFPSETGLSVYFRDRTEHVLDEQERARILEVIEYGDPVVVTDAEFRVIFVNTSEERMMRRPREQSLGRTLWELAPEAADPKRRFWPELHRVMEERVPVAFEEFFEPLEIWLGVTAYPTREGGIALFLRDISDRKRNEALQERLLGVVGHDLRSPLTSVRLGIARVAARRDVPVPARLTLERSLRAVDRMERMITALLDYSRLHAGGFAIERRSVDAAELLREVAAEFADSHPGRVEVDAPGPIPGRWDPDRLAQMAANLVGNALRHGDPTAPVRVRARADDAIVRISVHNEGAPIPPEACRTLFQPFQRHASRGGLGLGLYISRNIVRRHGGTIEVDSREGHGTTFTVTLPREPP